MPSSRRRTPDAARRRRRGAFNAGAICVGSTLALLAAGGCGSGTSANTSASVTAHVSSAPRQAATPVAHLSILSPPAGAHTDSTLTVRIAVSGALSTGAQRFLYVLDRHLTRSGPAHLTFHELAPGQHRLDVLLATVGMGHATAAHAATTFTVRAPAPAAVSAPAQTPPTTTGPPPSTPMTTSAPPPPKTTSAPPPGNGIPQGGGGDGDGDNSGGPSDGDGNV